MIKIILALTFLVVPTSLIYFNIFYSVEGQYFFSAFIIFVGMLRIWESFFTSKETKVLEYKGDWTLPVTSFFYLTTSLFIIFEFFIKFHRISILVTLIGLGIFFLSAFIRSSAIKKLGSQWKIHIGSQDRNNLEQKFIKEGPYRYIRHPIYLSYILELIGVAVAGHTFYSLIFIVSINVPLYILRARYEERNSLKKFGREYAQYISEVPLMFPRFIQK